MKAVHAGPRRFNRWLTFNAVGCMGIVVQLAALALLRSCGVDYLIATALAVEMAVLHNFAWHERWTWLDYVRADRQGPLSRLVRFNLTAGLVSIAQNLVLMKVLVEYFAIHDLAANVASIAGCSLINFFLSERCVFGKA